MLGSTADNPVPVTSKNKLTRLVGSARDFGGMCAIDTHKMTIAIPTKTIDEALALLAVWPNTRVVG